MEKKTPKFKKGDYITPVELYKGFEDAIVIDVDDEYYYLKIPNGKATMKIGAEVNYELKKGRKRLILG